MLIPPQMPMPMPLIVAYGIFFFALGACVGSFLNVVIWRLPYRGREIIYTGKIMSAAEAEKYQLVNQVVEPELLLPAARELAAAIARSPSRAVRLSKAVIVRTLEEGHAMGFALQEEALLECLASPESREIMEKFLGQE